MKNDTKRVVIIHRHIFKNAGTTFDWILKNNFGEAFCDHRDDIPMRKEGEKYLVRFLRENPHIKALSSHHIWFNFSEISDLELIPVVFLRHPIERIRSVYNFEREQQVETQGAINAKNKNFSEYVEWLMDDKVSAIIRNVQTRYLAGDKSVKPLKQNHLKIALNELKKQKFIGIVDLFDESLSLFDTELRKMGFTLDFSFQLQNVKQPVENANYESRAKEVLDDLGDIAQVVLEKNKFDLIIYQAAREKLLNSES
jgi:hypothetical protein